MENNYLHSARPLFPFPWNENRPNIEQIASENNFRENRIYYQLLSMVMVVFAMGGYFWPLAHLGKCSLIFLTFVWRILLHKIVYFSQMIRWFIGPFNFFIYRFLIISINLKKIPIGKLKKSKRRQTMRDLSHLFEPDPCDIQLYKSYPFYNIFDDPRPVIQRF